MSNSEMVNHFTRCYKISQATAKFESVVTCETHSTGMIPQKNGEPLFANSLHLRDVYDEVDLKDIFSESVDIDISH